MRKEAHLPESACITQRGDLMNHPRELFLPWNGMLAYPTAGEWMPTRLGKAWPPWRQRPGHDLSRVRSRKRFSTISYRRRPCHRGCLLDTWLGTRQQPSSERMLRRARASSGEPWQRGLVADHFISREDGTANLTECPTRRSIALYRALN